MTFLIPSAGTPVGVWNLLRGVIASKRDVTRFEEELRRRVGVRWCRCVNSGTTAFYLILKVLKESADEKNEVILPAYTAPSLVLPIKKAGLQPVLCDVSLETFNLDIERLEACITDRTLAVLVVHMFGLPCNIEEVRRITGERGVVLIEDAASSLGSRIRGKMTGGLGDVGFFSFNRGKNVSTAGGGCIMTDREDMLYTLDQKINLLQEPSPLLGVSISMKMVLLALAVRPVFYTLFYDGIARFKYTSLHTDFTVARYLPYQARVGRTLFKRFERIFQRRYHNGMLLYRVLREIRGLTVPLCIDRAFPVFNQFPLLLPDRNIRDRMHEAIRRDTRVESTTLYPEPIHRMYKETWDGTGDDPFPNATQMAERLLLIPTHPLVDADRLQRVVEVIRRYIVVSMSNRDDTPNGDSL